MSKRLQARWAAIPGVIFPSETKAKNKRPAKAKAAKKRRQKPATERYHPSYYAEPEKYTTRGKIRKTSEAPAPAPETWCSLTEAAKMLELSIARVSQLTKQLGIEQLVYFSSAQRRRRPFMGGSQAGLLQPSGNTCARC